MSALRAVLAVLLVALAANEALAVGEATLELNLAADEQVRRCLDLVAAKKRLEARACFHQVIDAAPESTAALRAESALATMQVEDTAALPTTPLVDWPFAPGRLELVLASGMFGVWNGVAAGAMLGANDVIVPAAAGTSGAVAMALGGAFGVGAFFAGELLDFSPGTSRLLISGLGWGFGLGVAISPWVFALQGVSWQAGNLLPDWRDWGEAEKTIAPVMLASVATGYLGALASGGLALVTDMSEGQVSTMNTGGWVGLALGLTLSPLLNVVGAGDPAWLGLGWASGGALGLVGGLAMAHMVELEVWEVLIIDAVTAVAVLLAGGGSAVIASGAGPASPIGPLVGGLAGVTIGATLIGSTAAVGYFRIAREERFSRLGFLPVDSFFAPPTAVLDRAGHVVPIASLVALRF